MVRGKDFERRAAKDFAGKRNPGSGAYDAMDTTGDVIHSHLYVECKHRQDRIRWIWNLLMDTMAKAKVEKKPGVVCFKLREPGSGGAKTAGYAVTVHIADLLPVARERALALAKRRWKPEVLDDDVERTRREENFRRQWDLFMATWGVT